MGETLFVFTNDDVGMHEPERFAELLDFLAEQEVPGTFFVVPAAERSATLGKRNRHPLADPTRCTREKNNLIFPEHLRYYRREDPDFKAR